MTMMNTPSDDQDHFSSPEPKNLSRRRFIQTSTGAAAGALILGFGIPVGSAHAQRSASAAAPGTYVPAFLEIHPDNSIHFKSPFMEGGQGIFTAMAQIVGEELDADPASFIVDSAPAGDQYKVMNIGMRITGGSMSVRTSYPTMRRLGALARMMMLQAASHQLRVSIDTLSTEPGYVIHKASGRSLRYGQLAPHAMDLPTPALDTVKLKDPSQFRWIGKPLKRLDVYEKSTGKATYGIDTHVEGMLQAAVQHAPRLGLKVGAIRNESQVKQMHGVHSIHQLQGAVAVVAERWWDARRAAEALQVDWQDLGPGSHPRYMPADFSTATFSEQLANANGPIDDAEVVGNVENVFAKAPTVVNATYHSQYLNHAQLEPPSALARFNPDGSLEVWMPNQAPELFQNDIAKRTGLPLDKIFIHSPLLGGFFGRHFVYENAVVYPQAIALAKKVGRPVKVIWSREEEFLRDTLRPMAAVKFRGALDDKGMPIGLEAISATEGPTEGISNKRGDKVDPSALEGLTGKTYAIPDRRIGQRFVKSPALIGYWRSVGNSMNDFFYEAFLDELADKGGKDPYALRLQLLQDNPRLSKLLQTVAQLSGGWKRGPFIASDGSRRARGVAMATAFGTETAAIAEVSIEQGRVRVHDIWEAIDPGSIVNPGIIEAQVNGAVGLGLSQVLIEASIFEKGAPVARNYDMYPILPPDRMARVHVQIVESGAKMGGIGEPPLPAVPPAVVNAVAHLTGKRIRSMPLSQQKFDT